MLLKRVKYTQRFEEKVVTQFEKIKGDVGPKAQQLTKLNM